jgi:hypothetical protein
MPLRSHLIPRLAAVAGVLAGLRVPPALAAQAPVVPPVRAVRAVPEAPFSADRPGFTTAPTLVAPGRQQIETGYAYARDGAERGHAVGELLLRAGLTSAVELRLALNSYELALSPTGRTSGLADAGLGAKIRLARGGDGPGLRPETALLVAASVPTGSRAFGRHRSEPEAALLATWSAPRSLALTVDVGVAGRDGGPGARTLESHAGSALEWARGEHLVGYVEYFAAWTASAPGSARAR